MAGRKDYRHYHKDYWDEDRNDPLSKMIQDSIDALDFEGLHARIQDLVKDIRDGINESVRTNRAPYGSRKRDWRTAPPPGRTDRPDSAHPYTGNVTNAPKKVPMIYPTHLPGTWSGPLRTSMGAIGVTVLGILGVSFLPVTLGLASTGGFSFGLALMVELIFCGMAGLSGWTMGMGIGAGKRVQRIREYVNRWKGKSYIMFSELASGTGQSLKQVREDMKFLIKRNLMPGARIDEEETCLLLTDEAIRLYEGAKQSQKEREAAEAKKQEEESFLENASEEDKELYLFTQQAKESLEAIEECRNNISSEEMHTKIDAIVLTLTRIFVCVKARPEKLRKTGRLMDYYIPIILKLLRVYGDMEDQPLQGENINKTLEEIDHSMDTINEALKTMFDELFQEEALDVSADIQVLKTMLAQDGWTSGI